MAKKPVMKSMDEIKEVATPVKVSPTSKGEDVPADEVYDPSIYSEVPGSKIETSVVEFDSHLFKLNVALVKKNVGVLTASPDDDPSQFMDLEHTHIFRTRDSEGKVPLSTIKTDNPQSSLMRSTPIAGHFHLIEMVQHPTDPTKPPVVKSISGPMTMGREKRKGKWVMVEVPLNDYDHHVHKIQYRNTEKVKAKAKNIEAQKVIALNAQQGAAPPGVIG